MLQLFHPGEQGDVPVDTLLILIQQQIDGRPAALQLSAQRDQRPLVLSCLLLQIVQGDLLSFGPPALVGDQSLQPIDLVPQLLVMHGVAPYLVPRPVRGVLPAAARWTCSAR
jgi:hypothetical protein